MNRPIFIRANSKQWGSWTASRKKVQPEPEPPHVNTIGKTLSSIDDADAKRRMVDEIDRKLSERSFGSKSSKQLETISEQHEHAHDDEEEDDESWEESLRQLHFPPEKSDREPRVETTVPPSHMLSDIVQADIMSSQDVSEYFHEKFTAHVAREAEKERPPLDVVLEASTALLHEFVSVSPENRMDRAMIHCELDAYIFPRITLLYSDISKIKISNVAKLISWADHYQQSLNALGIDVPMARLCDFEELVTEYLKRGVHDQMNLMIQNSLRLRKEEEVKADDSGQLATCHPEDIAFMVNMQISVARESLPPQYLSEVLTACNEEVFNMIGDIMLEVESRWKEMGVESICAYINDASRLSDQCDERNELLLDQSNKQHVDMGEMLCKELAELSLHATRYLCERIMLDLRDPDRILTRVGDPSWEMQKNVSVIDTTILTLKDYFEDIHEWLPHDYYFPKCIKHCFDTTMQMYVHAFFSNTMALGMDDPEQASSVLQKDWRKLTKFFHDEMGNYAGQAGHYSKQAIASRLDLLQALAHLLTPTIPPDQLEVELQTVIVQLGGVEAAIPALLHTAGLRQKGISKKNRAKEALWHDTLDRVTELLDDMMPSEQQESSSAGYFVYKLPDLRNSEYLRHIQSTIPTTEEIKKSSDSSSRPSLVGVSSTTKKLSRWNSLVKRPGLGQALGASFRASRRRMGLTPKSDRTLISNHWRDDRPSSSSSYEPNDDDKERGEDDNHDASTETKKNNDKNHRRGQDYARATNESNLSQRAAR